MSAESLLPWLGPKKGPIMRAIRLLAATVVLAAVSTFGATAAEAAPTHKVAIQYQGWQW